MAKSENVIRIPKPPKSAFNPHRPVSDLLWEQVEHMAAVVRRAIDEERRQIRTEIQASDFIRKYTAFLNPPDDVTKPASSSRRAAKKPSRSSKR